MGTYHLAYKLTYTTTLTISQQPYEESNLMSPLTVSLQVLGKRLSMHLASPNTTDSNTAASASLAS